MKSIMSSELKTVIKKNTVEELGVKEELSHLFPLWFVSLNKLSIVFGN